MPASPPPDGVPSGARGGWASGSDPSSGKSGRTPLSDGTWLLLLAGGGAVLLVLLRVILSRLMERPPNLPYRAFMVYALLYLGVQTAAMLAYALWATWTWRRRPRGAANLEPWMSIVALVAGGIAAFALLSLFGLLAFIIWLLFTFVKRPSRAGSSPGRAPSADPPETPAGMAAPAQPQPLDDAPLRRALTVVGILVGVASLMFGGMTRLFLCWGGCPNGVSPSLALLVALVPIGYIAICMAYLRSRQRMALADPFGAQQVRARQSVLGIASSALLLAFLAIMAVSFGLIWLTHL